MGCFHTCACFGDSGWHPWKHSSHPDPMVIKPMEVITEKQVIIRAKQVPTKHLANENACVAF